MINFIFFLNASQYGYSLFDGWFINHHILKSAHQCFVLLKIFLIFIRSGCSDNLHFSSCQSWFQNICGIHCSISTTSANKAMNFIDEQNNLAIATFYFIHNTFNTLFKFTFELSTGNNGGNVQNINLLGFEVFWHILFHNSPS